MMTTVNGSYGDFSDRTVVITGGAGGIGSALRNSFAAAGASTVTIDVAASDYQIDVTDLTALEATMKDIHSRHGGPDILVTLAGGSLGTPRDLDEQTVADVDKVLDVNIKGTLYASRAAMPYLRTNTGAIVTVSSIGGRQPSPVTGVPYATAKAAIGGLTRRLAAEYGPDGVRVNAVAPGLFLTERLQGMFDELPDNERSSVIDAIALRRMPSLPELISPIMFLASDAASFITGVTLDVNGGRYMPL